MQHALRPYITAGVAITGASLIAVTPAAVPLPGVSDVQARLVQLTAGEDDSVATLGPWLTELTDDFKQLNANFLFAPAVGLQQLIANVAGLNTAEGDTAPTLSDELAIMQAAITLSQGDLSDDDFADVVSAVTNHTLNADLDISGLGDGMLTVGHSLVFSNIGSFLPSIDPSIVNFLASPLSGVLFGMISPSLAPLGALQDSMTRIMDNLDDGDIQHALQDVLKLPLNMMGSVFTGSELNLDALIPVLADAGLLPEGTELNSIDLALGGLFSTGEVGAGDYTVDASTDPATTVTSVGGSIFNALGLNVTLEDGITVPIGGNPVTLEGPLTIDIPNAGVGPIGAMIGLQQAVAEALGMQWSGKDVTQAQAPLLGLDPFNDSGLKELLGIADTADDGSGSAVADGFGQVVADLLIGGWDQIFSDI